MLSRTADHLFWMARYIERAENTARMLDVNVQTALLPQDPENAEQGWRAMLSICELTEAFAKKHDEVSAEAVIDFMVKDSNNPSSIYCCLQGARENARAVRGALTTEVWETNNTTWLELKKVLADGTVERDPSEFFEWVKFRSHLSRGVTIGTMLKDDAFRFIRLGTFLERADNTARLLDVKFHSMPFSPLANLSTADPHADYYHWAAILRSVSAFETYRKVYRDVITPDRVAELLILRDDMPRSLLASLNEVCANLEMIRNDYSANTERRAGKLRAELLYSQIDDILQMGLHAYLTNFLERVNDLGNRISKDFLVPLEA
ncbi:alpha-E domain-containing protein [Limnobacter sp.]|uniref:alpha-E domain-containing protein n=1 Tax=Limnobacter sp. TaxID=2003368 RepID=UPI002732C026|nr:alpha-E domain-containing protein [Limnobacter sp.]MDP3271272.1 alpha-E domain-containing protein [Limnobacter sp.]